MRRTSLFAAVAATLALASAPSFARTFNYHGTLNADGKPAEGRYDLVLTLYSARSGGSIIAGPMTMYGVPVREGRFNTDVNIDSNTPVTHTAYLDVQVKESTGSAPLTSLAGRTPVSVDDTACPGAWSLDGNAGNPAGSILGTVDDNDVDMYANSAHLVNLSAGSNGVTLSPAATFYASGPHSTALSFSNGTAPDAAYSFAGGFSGGTSFAGSFVWGDSVGPAIFDTARDQFIAEAQGGVGINTALSPVGGPLDAEVTIAPTQPGLDSDLMLMENTTAPYGGFDIFAHADGYFGIDGIINNAGTIEYDPIMYVNFVGSSGGAIMFNGASANGALTVGTAGNNGNGALLSTGGTWTNASSRTFKEGFTAVDPLHILAKLVAMPVQTWFYKQAHDEGQHMGPVAEDFAATFGLGKDERHIATVDESGVAFAAIQGLNQKVESENARLEGLNAELGTKANAIAEQNEALRGELARVQARLEKLESR
ncbi:MAG TPA: hypothetical protein VGO25_11095 [Rhodanobacteraceae bacterium]|nr:hypothetical protein [Rhodanobacteraceae bacterium]